MMSPGICLQTNFQLFEGFFMKLIYLLVLLTSFTVFADETCQTSLYDFRITSSYIQGSGQGVHVRIAYNEQRTLSRRNLSDFKELISTLSDASNTDEILTNNDVTALDRFSITVADGAEGLISLKYVKGYDQSGMLIVRYMITQNGAFRCQ